MGDLIGSAAKTANAFLGGLVMASRVAGGVGLKERMISTGE